MGAIVPRHKMLSFYGVTTTTTDSTTTPPTVTTTTTYYRMKKFTQLSQSKNPQEYSRKYVDEPTQRTDVTGFAPQIDYGFDKHRSDPVLTDIVNITNDELLGADAVRTIITVDTETGDAYQREYTVSPGSEGDDVNIYKYAGSFKANGEQVKGTATTSDDWQTVTFSAASGT